MSSLKRAVVRHTRLARRAMAPAIEKLDALCTAGAQCPEVQASPVALLALQDLQAGVGTTHVLVAALQNAILEDRAATKAVGGAFARVEADLRVYERIIDDLAGGDAAILAGAGLLSRDEHTPRSALGDVTELVGKPGTRPAVAILSWPAAKGARGYAVEVCFTPDSPDGPWTALAHGRRLTHVVTAPAPRAPFLARVAAVDRNGNRSAWSPEILVTAR
jgi:hypothetical protein